MARYSLTTSSAVLTALLCMLCYALPPSAQQAPLTPGEPVQYLLSELASTQNNILTLRDGTVWRSNATQFGLAGSKVLLSGRNLRNGSNTLRLAGFDFTASYQSGQLNAKSGYRITLNSISADGRILHLSDQLQAFVHDADRLYSRNWSGNNALILSADFRTLIYLPTLQQVTIQIASAQAL